jgi:hypothetical protein
MQMTEDTLRLGLEAVQASLRLGRITRLGINNL